MRPLRLRAAGGVERRGDGAAVGRCGLHGAHHEVAGSEQQHGVDGAGITVERGLLQREDLDVTRAREGVGGEEQAEGQQLGEDEEPDRQIAGQPGFGGGRGVTARQSHLLCHDCSLDAWIAGPLDRH